MCLWRCVYLQDCVCVVFGNELITHNNSGSKPHIGIVCIININTYFYINLLESEVVWKPV